MSGSQKAKRNEMQSHKAKRVFTETKLNLISLGTFPKLGDRLRGTFLTLDYKIFNFVIFLSD